MPKARTPSNLSGIGAVVDIGTRQRFLRFALLSLLVAVSEGAGFVLLVPLLAHAGGTLATLPFGLTLHDLPLASLLAAFVLLVVVRAMAEVARRLAAQDLTVTVVDGLRMQAIDGLLQARWRWLSTLPRGQSEALLITNIERAGFGAEMIVGLVRLGFALAALGCAALIISPAAALSGAAAGIFVLLLFAPLRRRARALGEALSLRYERLHGQLGEVLGALRIIKSYGREERTAGDLDAHLGSLRQVERAYVRDSAWGHAALQIGGALAAAVLAWFALEVLAMPLPVLLPLAAIFVRALPLLGELQSSWQNWSHEAPALEQALATISTAREHRESDKGGGELRLRDSLTFSGICVVHHPERPALAGVDLLLEAKRLIVLTGASGAGKSTLADVASGLIAPDAGALAIDGVPLDPDKRRSWRARVAYVQQEPVLFSGTVRDNLLWAVPGASEDQLKRALEEASAGFVHRLPEGIDCDLGDGGRALSGGERQRIALARALLRDPDLIILDEATSAIDAASEQAIAEALHSMTSRRTVIAIAHRSLLIDIADRVIRLDEGRIARA